MKMINLVFGLLIIINGFVQAMRIMPEPIETTAQKGARFKNECAKIAQEELARKQEHIARIGLGSPDLEDEEVQLVAQQYVVIFCKNRIKNTVQDVFPQSPLLVKPIALNNWLEIEADRYLKQAEEDALRSRHKYFFSCFTTCCD